MHLNSRKKMSYTLNTKRYADYFPHYFAENHKKGTGPHECTECSYYGRIHGIFMGYCGKCAYEYRGYRGPGMEDKSYRSIEQQIEDNRSFFTRKVKITQNEREWNDCKTIFWKCCLFFLILVLLKLIF